MSPPSIESLVTFFYRCAWGILALYEDGALMAKTKRSVTFIIGTKTYRLTISEVKSSETSM